MHEVDRDVLEKAISNVGSGIEIGYDELIELANAADNWKKVIAITAHTNDPHVALGLALKANDVNVETIAAQAKELESLKAMTVEHSTIPVEILKDKLVAKQLATIADQADEIDRLNANIQSFVESNRGLQTRIDTLQKDLADYKVHTDVVCNDCGVVVPNKTPIPKAAKHDTGKPTFDLIPWLPLQELGKLYEFGANKYARNNWKKGMRWSRCYNALLRHLKAWWEDGETNDPETGCHHLSSVAWCAFTLIWYELKGVGEDDRDKDMH